MKRTIQIEIATVIKTLTCAGILLCSHHPVRGDAAVEIEYRSAADGTLQPARFYNPGKENAPMVVALHSWSGDYTQQLHVDIEKWCVEMGWAFMHPNFRGRNRTPAATGSELAVQDVVSAVAYAQQVANIDANSVYLIGTSGGGYKSLLMAGRYPDMWAGVSAWVPIYDLRDWYYETQERGLRYTGEIAASCGGVPGENDVVDAEYEKRSPITYMKQAKGVNLHINAGIRDGHDGSVPIGHSLMAFNAVANWRDRIRKRRIRQMVETASVPLALRSEIFDASYGEKQPLFRRQSGTATITIFDGDHELIAGAAIAWFESLHKERSP